MIWKAIKTIYINCSTLDGNITMKWKNITTPCQFMILCAKTLEQVESWEGVVLHIHCSSLLRDKATSWYDNLLGRWSWKGHLLVTLGKPLHVHCEGFPGDQSIELIQKFHTKDSLEKAIHQTQGRRPCSSCSLFRSPRRQSTLSHYNDFT